MSNAVSMFLRQVVLQRGIPFEMKLPQRAPLAYGSLTKEQFDAEMEKGMADIAAGRVYSACDVDHSPQKIEDMIDSLDFNALIRRRLGAELSTEELESCKKFDEMYEALHG